MAKIYFTKIHPVMTRAVQTHPTARKNQTTGYLGACRAQKVPENRII